MLLIGIFCLVHFRERWQELFCEARSTIHTPFLCLYWSGTFSSEMHICSWFYWCMNIQFLVCLSACLSVLPFVCLSVLLSITSHVAFTLMRSCWGGQSVILGQRSGVRVPCYSPPLSPAFHPPCRSVNIGVKSGQIGGVALYRVWNFLYFRSFHISVVVHKL